ncbi:MAG: ATP-binding protein, partial [Bacteroidota bacterium]
MILCILAMVSGYFIYSEIRVLANDRPEQENDTKLVKTGALVMALYEAESLSKLALQSKTKKSFTAYAKKIDSIFIEIDTLKWLTGSDFQKAKLDTIQGLLEQKLSNNAELRDLKLSHQNNSSFDHALEEFKKLETSFGKLTIHNFEKNPERLSSYQRKVLEDWVGYLNKNIPADPTAPPDPEKIDSILNTSKTLLATAKTQDSITQRFLAKKEKQINMVDLELSQQLRNIISTFEREMVVSSYNNTLKKETALRRSIRLAGMAALLGFVIVGIFTFLINQDFWKAQNYREKLEKEKRHSESLLKSREQLISTVSHDLKTPLNVIQGYTELMEQSTLTSKQKGYLEKVASTVQYVTNLINDLLDFSKLEVGQLKLHKSPFIPGNLIRETAENLQALFTDKRLQLDVEIDPILENTVRGDAVRLRQILINLIGNAFKFTEEGSISITAKAIKEGKNGVTAQISVTDTGIGIALEKQQLIFTEFVQADTETEKEFGGYGLGLTISKKLSELLKGSLTLKSKLGQGSTFTLTLPLEKSFEPAWPTIEKREHAQKHYGILIIDDDTALLTMLGAMMDSLGIHTYRFDNFLSINKDSELIYDVILTDIQMPEITGLEVLQRLRSQGYSHYTDQPIIAMTGKSDLDITNYISLGFAHILKKPFSKNELVSVLKSLGMHPRKAPPATVHRYHQNKENPTYRLDVIQSFLGSSKETLVPIVQTFLQDTQCNMKMLDDVAKAGNY